MSYVANFKVPRVRSRKHMAFIGSLGCMICGASAQVHHLTCSPDPKARGLKAGDRWAIPLCSTHHDAQSMDGVHHDGDERAWWGKHGIDPIAAAQKFWDMSVAEGRA